LDHAGVYRDWRLPAVFTDLRTSLETRHGPGAGARQYIRVLQLLADHPLTRVHQAVEDCHQKGLCDAALIRRRVEHLAARDQPSPVTLGSLVTHPVTDVDVPRPDLGRFNDLLPAGDPIHV
jgi:hypothetical protein